MNKTIVCKLLMELFLFTIVMNSLIGCLEFEETLTGSIKSEATLEDDGELILDYPVPDAKLATGQAVGNIDSDEINIPLKNLITI